LEIVQNSMNLIFKISIYLRIAFGDWNYCWLLFIILTALIVRIVLINKFSDEFNNVSSKIKTVIRIFSVIFIPSVLLKLDNLSELTWSGVFWYFPILT